MSDKKWHLNQFDVVFKDPFFNKDLYEKSDLVSMLKLIGMKPAYINRWDSVKDLRMEIDHYVNYGDFRFLSPIRAQDNYKGSMNFFHIMQKVANIAIRRGNEV